MLCFSSFWAIVVMAALQSPYAASDALLLDFGLQAIASLAGHCPANQAQLGELGACTGTLFNALLTSHWVTKLNWGLPLPSS